MIFAGHDTPWRIVGTCAATAIGAAMVAAAFIDLSYLTRPWREETLGRLSGAAAIIAGCGTIVLLVLAKINQRIVPAVVRGVDDMTDYTTITLVCPRCGSREAIRIGHGNCGACGLTIEVQVRSS